MANNTIIQLNFSANLSTLKDVQKLMDDIKSKKDIELDVGGKETFTILESRLKAFVSAVESKLGPNGELSKEDFLNFSAQFKDIIGLVNKLQKSLVKVSVSPETEESLEKIRSKIEATNELLKEQQKLSKRPVGFNVGEDGKLSATKTKLNEVAYKTASQFDLHQLDKPDMLLRSYDAIEKAVNKINAAQEEYANNPNAQNIIAAWEEIQKTIASATNTAQENLQAAQAKVEELTKELENLKQELEDTQSKGLVDAGASKDIQGTIDSVSSLSTNLQSGFSSAQQAATQKTKDLSDSVKKLSDVTDNANDKTNKVTSTFGRAVKNVVSYGTAINIVKSLYNNFISTIRELDKALTNMTVVTNLTREQAWNLTGTIQELGKATGQTGTEIANMITMYLQQGKTLKEATTLTEAAAKAARIAGISGTESINLLTNAMNGFQLSADKAMEVSDKFAALAASAATNYEELATALSKVAAQANLAGMSMDFTLGMLTKGIEVTREAPETIGTALKTVISRMRELTDYGKTLEDGIDVNRVDKALKNIGVSLLDANNEFRNLDEVLSEVGQKWDSLNKNQQANVAVALAGTRQQSRLIAMMQDWGRTEELVKVSMESSGTTMSQHRKYMQGLESATTKLATAYQSFITSISNSDIAIAAINALSQGLETLSQHSDLVIGALAGLGFVFAGVAKNSLENAMATKMLEAEKLRMIELTKYEIELSQKEALAEGQKRQQELEAIIVKQREEAAEAALNEEKISGIVTTLESTKVEQESVLATKKKTLASREAKLGKLEEREAILENTIAERDATIQTLRNLRATGQITAEQEKELRVLHNSAAEQKEYIELQKIREEKTKALEKVKRAEQAVDKAQQDVDKTNQKLSEQKIKQEEAINKRKIAMQTAQTTATELATVAQKVFDLQQELGTQLEGKSLSQKMALIGVMLLEKIGLGDTALAQNLRNKATSKAIKLTAADAIMSGVDAVAKWIQKGATDKLTTSTIKLNKAMSTNPIGGIVTLVVLLVTALIAAAEKTGKLEKITTSLGEVLDGVFNVLAPIIDIVMTLLDTIMVALQPVIDILVFVLQIVSVVVQALGAVLNIVGQAVGFLVNNHLKNLQRVFNWVSKLFNIDSSTFSADFEKMMNDLTKKVEYFFASSTERIEQNTEAIRENQDIIAENEDLVKKLDPLVNEYDELSKKVNRTNEEEERLKTLADEISQIDNSLVVDGEVKLADAKNKVAEAQKEINDAIDKNIDLVRESQKEAKNATGKDKEEAEEKLNSEENKAAIADGAKRLLKENGKDLSSAELSKINEQINAAMKEVDITEDTNIGELQKDLATVYLGVNTVFKDDSKSTQQKLQEYQNELDKIDDENLRKTVQSQYSQYQDVIDLKLGSTGFNSLDALKISPEEISNLKETWTDAGEEAEAFNTAFKKAIESDDPYQALAKMAVGASVEMQNALLDIIPSTQEITEQNKKLVSSYKNVKDAAEKFAKGEMGPEELQAFMAENSDLFADPEFLKYWDSGTVDKWYEERVEKENEVATKELAARNKFLQALADGTNDEMLKNDYLSQIVQNNNLIEYYNKQSLYADKLYQDAKAMSELDKQRIADAKQLAEIQKKFNEDNLNSYKEYADELKRNIQREKDFLYGAGNKETEWEQIMKSGAAYLDADGKIVIDAGKYEGLSKDLQKWLNENKATVEKSLSIIKENNETLFNLHKDYEKKILENEKEKLEERLEAYEEYWDKIDAEEEAAERENNRESIIKQLGALAGGINTKAKEQELKQQLEEINKEEREAIKQARRDAIQKSIEEEVASIESKIDEIDKIELEGVETFEEAVNQLSNVVQGLGGPGGDKQEQNSSTSDNVYRENSNGNNDFNYRGAIQAGLDTASTFQTIDTSSSISNTASYITTNNVTVETINIHTDQLNYSQDWRNAGEILATEFNAALQARGIKVNAKG